MEWQCSYVYMGLDLGYIGGGFVLHFHGSGGIGYGKRRLDGRHDESNQYGKLHLAEGY